jgi:hypothetical protein
MLAIGAAAIVLSADWRDRVIAPGPLARPHAQLLQRTGDAANCAACHAAAERNLAGWMASLVVAPSQQPTQSELCMKCHSQTIPAQFALAAHNVPASVLERITAGRSLAPPGPEKKRGSLACAACHAEHHGARVDLTAIADVACQSCHVRRYESFAGDHPDFGVWPYERRTRIAFDHAIHREKHFAEKKKSFDCRSCHAEDATGQVQRLAGYELACAGCHDEKIATSLARGIPMLGLPALDVAALRAAGFDIGAWPKAATGDFDGRLPPAMKVLLAADPGASDAMLRLGPNFDFQDIDPNDRRQLEACAAIATAIKKLIREMMESADGAVGIRLPAALERPISASDAEALVAGWSADTLRIAAHDWALGPPATGVGSAKVGVSANRTQIAFNSRHSFAFALVGRWFHDAASLSIRYRPAGHADPLMATWLNVLAETPNVEKHPIAAAMLKELSKATSPGLCITCHSLEQTPSGKVMVNWRAYDRGADARGFTKFAHGPHLVLPQLADCTPCHAIDAAPRGAVAYTGLDPVRFVSEFAPMTRRQCAECHTASAAGDACQKCHHYHVDAAPGGAGEPASASRRENIELPIKGLGRKSAIHSRQSEIR